MSVDVLHLEVAAVRVLTCGRRDEQRLGHGLALERVLLGNENPFALLILDTDGTCIQKYYKISTELFLAYEEALIFTLIHSNHRKSYNLKRPREPTSQRFVC